MNAPSAAAAHDGLAAGIAAWLPGARWFADKGRVIAGVAVADACPAGDGIVLAIVDVRFAAGESSRYAVPVAAATGADACCTPAFAAWLVHAAVSGHACGSAAGGFQGHAAPGQRVPPPTGPVAVVPLGGDASNTSFLVRSTGRQFVCKLLRRCRPGIQPEVEIGEFFATAAPWAGTPPLRGWLEYRPRDAAGPIAVATVHDFAADCATAWDLLGGLVAEGGLEGGCRERVLSIAGALGRGTAGMHAALASRPDVPAFAPVSPSSADMHAAADALAAHAESVFDLVAERAASLPAAVAARLRAVLAARTGLLRRLRNLAAIGPAATVIRVHGDYHLGQVLIAPDDRVLVIDFEGEPGRTLEARRARAFACKDVAGMCRSFDYLLRHAAATGAAAHRPEDAAAIERHFLDAYLSIAAGRPWWPADPRDAARLLAIHTLDKALYELAYEIRNRPDWITVPLAAVETLAGTA
jgi:trehalose synthase-fused probable maltokinase